MTISAEEIATWRKLYGETQEALQRIGDEFGVLAGEERTSGVRRILAEQRARITALEAQLAEAVANEREECAKIADAYADENIRSSIDFARSEELQIHGTIHSAMYHAAANVSGAIRARSEQERK